MATFITSFFGNVLFIGPYSNDFYEQFESVHRQWFVSNVALRM